MTDRLIFPDDFPGVTPAGPPILAGRLYRYARDLPRGCRGSIYRVHGFVLDVPTNTEKVLVNCIRGKDRGLWFVCTPMNFVQRYELLAGTEGTEAATAAAAAGPQEPVLPPSVEEVQEGRVWRRKRESSSG